MKSYNKDNKDTIYIHKMHIFHLKFLLKNEWYHDKITFLKRSKEKRQIHEAIKKRYTQISFSYERKNKFIKKLNLSVKYIKSGKFIFLQNNSIRKLRQVKTMSIKNLLWYWKSQNLQNNFIQDQTFRKIMISKCCSKSKWYLQGTVPRKFWEQGIETQEHLACPDRIKIDPSKL